MSKVPQERMPVGQRWVTPLLQSVASRKPRSVLPTVTRRNSIVLIAGIKRNLYLKGQTSGLRDRFATENKLLSPVPGPCSSMDFDQLETFLEVARHASFSRAAEKRFRTQPAISSQIRGVEEEVGAKLFDRSGGKVSLTAAGKAFLKYVEETLDARKAMMVAIAEMERVPRGEIIVGANEGTCLHMLPYVFADFKKQYPEVSVNIKRSDYAKILESIIDNSVDFGVISLPVNDNRLTVVLIHRDELIVIAPPQHPLGKMKSATIADASKFPLIVPKAGHTRDAIEQLFHERRLKPNFTMELDSS